MVSICDGVRAYCDATVGRGCLVEGKVDEDVVGILGKGGGGLQDNTGLRITEGL